MTRRKILPSPPKLKEPSSPGYPGAALGSPRRKTTAHQATSQQTADELSSLLAAIVDSSDDAIYSCTLDGAITSWNRGAERIFGYKAAEMIGQPASALSAPNSEDPPALLLQVRKGRRVDHFETLRRHKDGSDIIVSLSVSPVRDSSGVIIGASKIARDITSTRQAEQALRNADKLALAGRMAASIAHEINNPLEAITNLVYLLQQESLSPQASHYLDLAQHELTRVSTIASQTLHFFRGAAGPSFTRLSEIADSAISLHTGRLLVSGISVETRYRPTSPLFCQQGELRQVLVNLVSNALDAMPSSGRLLIRSRPATDTLTGSPGLRLTVADTGSGMSPRTLRLLFEPFYTTKGASGTGLGLWVTQQIIARHKGRITVRSRQGSGRQGTVFSIFLPYLEPAAATADPAASRSPQPIDCAQPTSREDASRHTPAEPDSPSTAYNAA